MSDISEILEEAGTESLQPEVEMEDDPSLRDEEDAGRGEEDAEDAAAEEMTLETAAAEAAAEESWWEEAARYGQEGEGGGSEEGGDEYGGVDWGDTGDSGGGAAPTTTQTDTAPETEVEKEEEKQSEKKEGQSELWESPGHVPDASRATLQHELEAKWGVAPAGPVGRSKADQAAQSTTPLPTRSTTQQATRTTPAPAGRNTTTQVTRTTPTPSKSTTATIIKKPVFKKPTGTVSQATRVVGSEESSYFQGADSLAAGVSPALVFHGITIKSPLPGVSNASWGAFVRGMVTAPAESVSPSNALGMFEMKPRRLADLGIVDGITYVRHPTSGRMVWVGDFRPPLSAKKFLADAAIQYRLFAQSMTDYAQRIKDGEIKVPAGMSLSGALAVLHRAGAGGLNGGKLFPETAAIRRRSEGIF